MPARPSSSAPAPSAGERLMRLVPERVGSWKRHMLRGARVGRDGQKPAAVEAEFRHGNVRVLLSVTETGAPPPPAADVDRTTSEGSEKIYADGGATVRETVRRIDGRTEVALMRPDGITVIAQAIGVSAADLKALAQGVKAAAR